MIKLVINADDYGMDENRTRAILAAYDAGCVTATTAMANMPWFDHAMQMAKGTGLYANIGIHLNLTAGFPLTDPIKECRFFCTDQGEFHGRFHDSAKTRVLLPSSCREPLAIEVDAQIKKFLDYEGVHCHLDSHHHVHTDFSIAKVVFPIISRFGFRSVRMSRNFGSRMNVVKRVYKFIYNLYASHAIGFAVDKFADYGDVEKYFNELSEGDRVEVMVHPTMGDFNHLDIKGELVDVFMPMKRQLAFYESLGKVAILCGYDKL